MSQTLQPCKILSVVSPNLFVIQNQQNKVINIGNGSTIFPYQPTQHALDLYYRQSQLVGKDAVYSTKAGNIALQVQGKDVLEPIPDGQPLDLKYIGVRYDHLEADTVIVREFNRTKRNKEITATMVSVQGNTFNFLLDQKTMINVIPASIYIDDFGIQDGGFKKLIEKQWLSRQFTIKFKGIQTLQVPTEGKFYHIPTLKAEIHESNQANLELSNQFYCSIVSCGFGYITDLGRTSLAQNSFQILFQCQEDAKRSHLGLWKNGELDRKMLNSVSSQQVGTVVEIVEANQYLVQTSEELLNIKLDRIFIEGLEAKEFARKLLIGRKVHILQLGENVPSYSIQIAQTNKNVEEELIVNGWAIIKEHHPHLSKYKLQIFQQLNQQAKQNKIGQYSQDISWRIDDQTDKKHGKNVNQNVWQTILREREARKQSFVQPLAVDNQIEVIINKICGGNLFHIISPTHYAILNFQIANLVDLNDYSTSFPNIVLYDEQRRKFTYQTIMQRNAWVVCDSFNIQTNTLVGKLYTKKNNLQSDFALELLKNGYTILNSNVEYFQSYSDAQKQAVQAKAGIWREPYAQFLLDLSMNKVSQKQKSKTVKESNIKKQTEALSQAVIVSEIVDSSEFYIRKAVNPELDQIEMFLETTELKALPKPVKKGTLCLARFYDDNKLYRAQVMMEFKNDTSLVRFIDYGNEDQVAYADLGYLPPELATIPKQAQLCGLAYLRVPNADHPFAEEAAGMLRDAVWEQEINAKVAYVDSVGGLKQYVLLYQPDGVEDIEHSINATLLLTGIGRIEDRVLYNPLKSVVQYQEQARTEMRGLWMHDDQLDNQNIYHDDLTYLQS